MLCIARSLSERRKNRTLIRRIRRIKADFFRKIRKDQPNPLDPRSIGFLSDSLLGQIFYTISHEAKMS
jgi:hypothetical protein